MSGSRRRSGELIQWRRPRSFGLPVSVGPRRPRFRRGTARFAEGFASRRETLYIDPDDPNVWEIMWPAQILAIHGAGIVRLGGPIRFGFFIRLCNGLCPACGSTMADCPICFGCGETFMSETTRAQVTRWDEAGRPRLA